MHTFGHEGASNREKTINLALQPSAKKRHREGTAWPPGSHQALGRDPGRSDHLAGKTGCNLEARQVGGENLGRSKTCRLPASLAHGSFPPVSFGSRSSLPPGLPSLPCDTRYCPSFLCSKSLGAPSSPPPPLCVGVRPPWLDWALLGTGAETLVCPSSCSPSCRGRGCELSDTHPLAQVSWHLLTPWSFLLGTGLTELGWLSQMGKLRPRHYPHPLSWCKCHSQ